MQMSVTLRELLKLPIYKKYVQVVNEGNINNIVRSLTVMEAPDFHVSSLSRNALVLTTLSAHHESIDDINRTVEALCRARIAGIMIKVGRYVDMIEESTLDIAKRYGMPLLTLSSNVYFTDILTDSFYYIADDRAALIEEINSLNNQLMNAILRNRSVRDLMRIIDRKFNSRSYLLDTHFEVVDSTSKNSRELESVIEVAKILASHREKDRKYRFQQRDGIVVHACENRDIDEGYYCISVNEGDETPLALYMQMFSRILSIKLFENEIVENTKQQMTAALIDDILFTTHKDESVITDRLKMLHFTPLDRHFIMIINKSGKQGKKNVFHRAIEKALSAKYSSFFVFLMEDSFVAIVSERESESSRHFRENVNCCMEILEKTESNIHAACSSVTADLCDIPNHYTQAKRAMRFGSNSGDQGVYFYDDYIEIGLVYHGLESHTADIFFEKIINPLLEYDKQYSSKLWSSLECCFQTQSLEEASRKMFIHISTLRYRIQKIEQLTGLNYMKRSDRHRLYMAYILYRAGCNRPETEEEAAP